MQQKQATEFINYVCISNKFIKVSIDFTGDLNFSIFPYN